MSKLSYYKTIVKISFLLSLVLFGPAGLRAQNSFSIVAGAGKTSLNKLQGTSAEFTGYSSRTSYWGGFKGDLGLGPTGLSIWFSAIYNKKGYTYGLKKETGATNTVKDSAYSQDLNYADVQLSLVKKFYLDDRTSFFIGAGPSMSVFISGKEQTSLGYFGNTRPSTETTKSTLEVGTAPGTYKRLFPSMVLSAGVELNRFSIWVHYSLPLDYYYLDARKQLQHRIKTFGVSASYALFMGKRPERTKKEKPAIEKETVKKDTLTDSDGDGIPNYLDKCPGHKGIAKYNGCPVPDADGDGINDDDDKCPMVAGSIDKGGCPSFNEPSKPSEPKDTMKLIIYFEPGKSQLRTEGFSTLNQVVQLMKKNKHLVAQFNGHTDNVGSVEANSIRAFDRAMVCVDYVSSFFIERKRLTAAAFSNKKPVADLNDPLLQWKNRRVEILLFEGDQ